MPEKYNLPNKITITAHSGCENTADNSIESIIKSFESGADIFEVDVQFTETGIPVLSHDDVIGGEVTIETAFKMLKKYADMKCNLDIKNTLNLKIIPDIAKQYDVIDRIFYTGINIDFVKDAKETPEIPYYLNCNIEPIENHSSEYYGSLIKTIKEYGAIGLNCHHKNVTKELVDILHQNGLLASIWTCDAESDIIRVLECSPDNITSKKPSLVRNIICLNQN